jgi:hypothetical protein
MSADNGYIIRKTKDGKYALQMYFASADSYPPVEDARPEEIFDSVEAAVAAYDKMEDEHGFVSEYGLSFDSEVLMTRELHKYGYIIREESGVFYLQTYTEGFSFLPIEETLLFNRFETLDEAVRGYVKSVAESQIPAVLGLKVILEDPKRWSASSSSGAKSSIP